MLRVIDLLKNNTVVGYSAATNDGSKPEVRAFMVLHIEKRTIYFATGVGEKVCKQIEAHPFIAFRTIEGTSKSVRVTGKAKFIDNIAVKSALLRKNTTVMDIYGSGDNPELKVLYIKTATVEVFDISVIPPRRESVDWTLS
jgi:uncharacterized pyridoxamine 5'-phosphate oxidase family protein